MKLKKGQLCFLGLFLLLTLFLKTSECKVGVEWKVLGTFKLEKDPLDIALSIDGKTAYILTRGYVVIYASEENKVIERIPINENITNIWVSPNGNFVYLKNTKSKELSVIRLDLFFEIEKGNSILLGKQDAPVTLVAFMDFQCPFCAKAYSILQQVLEQYPSGVEIVLKHFPLKNHLYAEKAALASLSAYRQEKFLEMADIFFKNYNTFDDGTIDQSAKKIGLNMESFKREMESEPLKKILYEDLEMSKRLNIGGVPAIFLNGKKINNRFLSHLPEMISEELKKKKVSYYVVENPDNDDSLSSARKGTIAGSVMDQSGAPIPWASVIITSGTAPFPDIAALTNERGEYKFSNILEGTFEITVKKEGYLAQKKKVVVSHEEVSQLNFTMQSINDKP